MKKSTVVFTGGGTAGHVTPNLAIMSQLDKHKWNFEYIGSHTGIERELINKIDIPYHPISSGKLRRYIDMENVKDIFRVTKGIIQARSTLKKIKPNVVFSKGGFVSVPVVIAAKSLGIPSYIHESDITPGLANKLASKFATKIFVSFDETVKYFPGDKAEAIGSPIRPEILTGSREKGLKFLGFNGKKQVIIVMGGSLGARAINDAVRKSLPLLEDQFQIVHMCGKGNIDESFVDHPNYRQFEYLNEELSDVLAAGDLVITRGGSNAIFEFLALKKPMIIIPLPKAQSRGDQILNANSFEKSGFAVKLDEENLTIDILVNEVREISKNKQKFIHTMEAVKTSNAVSRIVTEINKHQ